MMGKLYVAYGSNMNLEQMRWRCPTARVVGTGFIRGRELVFNGVATIAPKRGGSVPIVVWDITARDESELDRYEGFPHLYRKESINAWIQGEKWECMVYIMNRHGISPPSHEYFECIRRGYVANRIPTPPLEAALERSRRGV